MNNPNLLSNIKGKKVFLTGHTGFKGSWLCMWLKMLEAEVYGFSDKIPSNPSNFTVSRVSELINEDIRGDINDPNSLFENINRIKPEIVFHLAAQPLVRLGYQQPSETFSTNVMGTVNVLDAVRKAANPCIVIIITTDKCYENKEHIWGYRECDEMGGYDPYSASKGCAELVVSSYRNSFFNIKKINEHGISVASARAGNVIGGGDWADDRIVVDIVKNLMAGKSVPVRNPHAIRPWQHVLEPLSGYLTLANKMLADNTGKYAEAWNFGPVSGTEAAVGELVTKFCELWDNGASWEDVRSDQAPHEANILRLCIDKAVTRLHWRPQWNFQQTIEHTMRWYKRYQNSENMQDECKLEIKEYMSFME